MCCVPTQLQPFQNTNAIATHIYLARLRNWFPVVVVVYLIYKMRPLLQHVCPSDQIGQLLNERAYLGYFVISSLFFLRFSHIHISRYSWFFLSPIFPLCFREPLGVNFELYNCTIGSLNRRPIPMENKQQRTKHNITIDDTLCISI